jgi:hypothetical protein
METNNLKIKVSYIMLERHKDEPQAVINYIKTQITTGTLTTEALEIMEDEARADQDKRWLNSENILAKSNRVKKACSDTAEQIFAELDNLHIVENRSTQKGKGIPLLLKQIGAYKSVKKKFGVSK